MLHIYTGDGKGKTTAACGLCIRAAGSDKKILFAQFLKNGSSGEISVLKKLGVDTLHNYPTSKFLWNMNAEERAEISECCHKLLEKISALSPTYDIIVLDEVFGVLYSELITEDMILSFIASNKEKEIILTGRNAPASLICKADYVSEMICVKHPANEGTAARKGIEY